MKIVLVSMPDVVPLLMHEDVAHLPNLGIASLGGQIDEKHQVYIIDLIRKRKRIRKYLTKKLRQIEPDLIGLSSMAWQYDTCAKILRLIRGLLPEVKIVIGGYHPTLMHDEIADSPEVENINFMIRGEGEEAFRRLVNALNGEDKLEEIPSLSYKRNGKFIHNPRGELLDLDRLQLPIRDKRRLTWGYHMMYSKIEAMETSRGCTRSCKFCSMHHMYGRTFRTFPLERVLADMDDIYYRKKTRCIFIVDDNLVLSPKRVIGLCDAIIEKEYKNMVLFAQTDCVSIASNEEMVKKMALAGFRVVFLGIDNASEENLAAAEKGNIIQASKKAIANCHKHGIFVIGGLVFGFPDDDEASIIRNYQFFCDHKVDAAYCQILTPYPKTMIREDLIAQGLITNMTDYRWYNGVWANAKTKHLDSDRLQYLVWYHRQKVLGWWEPSNYVRKNGWLWTTLWAYFFRPIMKIAVYWTLRKYGWEGRYRRVFERYSKMNVYADLEQD